MRFAGSFAALVLLLQAAPPSKLIPLDEATYTNTLAAKKGKVLLVNFWATWCEPCRVEMPEVEALFRRSGERFSVIGVSMDDDALKIPPFLKEYKVTFPIVMVDRKVSASYAVRGLPTAFLIDAEGRIARRWVGPLDVRAAENDILALLTRRPS